MAHLARFRLSAFVLVVVLSPAIFLRAGDSGGDADYARVAVQRADKIVAPLALAAAKHVRVQEIVARQYIDLRDLHARRDAVVAAASGDDAAMAAARDAIAREQHALHVTFLSRLAAELSSAQVDQIKDGLTYGVLPGTYHRCLELYPQLTEEQRTQILAWLIEAREYAMDGGSAEEKHGWFGKYKGRINNYLSAAGYDAKEAERAWAERTKAPPAGATIAE